MLPPRPAPTLTRCRAFLILVAILAAPCAARADGAVTFETGAGQSKPTTTLPTSTFEYQKLAGRYAATETLTLSAMTRLTHDLAAAAEPGTTLATGDDWIFSGSIGADDDVARHLNLGLALDGAAPSTRTVAAPFSAPTAQGQTLSSYATVDATTWNLGATADVTYDTSDDTAPERALDATIDLSAGVEHFSTTQNMTSFEQASGNVTTVAAFEAGCARSHPSPLCLATSHASGSATGSLNQLRLGATLTGILWTRTDASLDAAYYLYDAASPDDVGLFSFTPAGSADAATYGAGLPMAPPRATIRGDVGHRWSALSLRAWYQLTSYTLADSIGNAAGGKAQVYLGAWRVYATGSYRVDSLGGVTADTWTAGLGVTRTL
jgi:hypothetical protein